MSPSDSKINPWGKDALLFACIVVLIMKCSLTLGLSDDFVSCYHCTSETRADCVQNYPATDKEEKNLVQCGRNEQGCITYEYNVTDKDENGADITYAMGGKRCICNAEVNCLKKQNIDLEPSEHAYVFISWSKYEDCMEEYDSVDISGPGKTGNESEIINEDVSTKSPISITGGNLTRLHIFYCEEEGCNGVVKESSSAGYSIGKGSVALIVTSIIVIHVEVKLTTE